MTECLICLQNLDEPLIPLPCRVCQPHAENKKAIHRTCLAENVKQRVLDQNGTMLNSEEIRFAGSDIQVLCPHCNFPLQTIQSPAPYWRTLWLYIRGFSDYLAGVVGLCIYLYIASTSVWWSPELSNYISTWFLYAITFSVWAIIFAIATAVSAACLSFLHSKKWILDRIHNHIEEEYYIPHSI